ncbi:MAG: RNA-binding protein [Methanomicrobiales archaeon HGW-Methanomicrobiales-4]|nr:MAG: RNA-binding protein [Methanomicrobiales archaeon HGW-Methanomicrobiales-4]
MSQDRIRTRKKTTTKVPGGFHDLKPTIWVGKQGMTETIIEEIRSQIKVRKIIKLKWLESTDVDPKNVASESGTVLLQVRGRTMVLGDSGSTPGTRSRNI